MSADPLTILASSDPALALEPLSGDDLAARRAAVPTPPLAERPNPRRRTAPLRGVVVALVALGLLASVAVAGGFRPWERDLSRQVGPGPTGTAADDVFQREYASAQRGLELPPGGTWPERSIPGNSVIMTGRGGMGESSAVMIAIDQWACWVVGEQRAGRVASARTGATSLSALIRDHVFVVPDGTPEDGAAPSELPAPLAQFADDGGKEMLLRAASEAGRGDVALLAQSCRANRDDARP